MKVVGSESVACDSSISYFYSYFSHLVLSGILFNPFFAWHSSHASSCGFFFRKRIACRELTKIPEVAKSFTFVDEASCSVKKYNAMWQIALGTTLGGGEGEEFVS